MPRIYMAIAQEDRFPIADILRQTPEIPANCQWALFLRNHDELTLEMVTDVERDYLWSTYATDPRARINLGIRRRLASLMDNDRRKIELMNSLLFSFPGTPIIYYGDEIGMGDNIYLGDRNGVRTPMQWTSDRNGGFSRCDPARLYPAGHHGPGLRPPVRQRRGAAAQPLVAAELDEAADRRAAIQQGVRPRHADASSGRPTAPCWPTCGSTRTTPSCASPTCRARRRPPRSTCSPWKGRVPLEMLGRSAFPAHRRAALSSSRSRPTASSGSCFASSRSRRPPRAVPPRVHHAGLDRRLEFAARAAASATRSSTTCCRLPARAPLVRRKGARPVHRQARSQSSRWSATACSAALAFVDVPGDAAARRRYLLPLMVDGRASTASSAPTPNVVAAVRRGPREGTLLDAAADREFVATLLRGHARRRRRSSRAITDSNSVRPAPSSEMPPPALRQGHGRRIASSPTPP